MSKINDYDIIVIVVNSHIPRTPHTPYDSILSTLFLDSLKLHGIRHELYFLCNILHNNIDCPEFIDCLSSLVSQQSIRSQAFFCVPTQRANYIVNAQLT